MFFSNFDSMRKIHKVLFVLFSVLFFGTTVYNVLKKLHYDKYQFENHSEIPKNNY